MRRPSRPVSRRLGTGVERACGHPPRCGDRRRARGRPRPRSPGSPAGSPSGERAVWRSWSRWASSACSGSWARRSSPTRRRTQLVVQPEQAEGVRSADLQRPRDVCLRRAGRRDTPPALSASTLRAAVNDSDRGLRYPHGCPAHCSSLARNARTSLISIIRCSGSVGERSKLYCSYQARASSRLACMSRTRAPIASAASRQRSITS